MAALVRHDAGAQAPQFVCANIEPRADARETLADTLRIADTRPKRAMPDAPPATHAV
jgi:hypothetical protein